jgi:3-hydroxy acid dehydrogenase / malonic semialdehyde reductase
MIFAHDNFEYSLTQIYHILFARRVERLQELKSQILEQYPNTQIHTCGVDVRNKQAIDDAITNLPQELKDVDVLVNNVT